jgi:tetratricopeptide (TPR) repeat protein
MKIKMKYLLYLSAIIFVIVSLQSNTRILRQSTDDYVDYHLIANQAILAGLMSNYEDVIRNFENATTYAPLYYDDTRNDDYSLGRCYAKLGDKKQAFKHLKNALLKGYGFEQLKNDTLLIDFRSSKEWKILEKNQEIYKEYFKKSIDISMYNYVIKLFEVDQEYREIFPQTPDVISQWKKADSLNLIALKKILITYEGRFPLYKDIGTSKILTIFMHMPRDFREPYLEVLKQELLKGNLAPTTYTMIVDNFHWHNPEMDTTIYGSAIWRNPETSRFEVKYKLKDFPMLNEMRKSVGMFTVEEQQKYIDYLFKNYEQ